MWPYLTVTAAVLAGGLLLGEQKNSRRGMELLYWGGGAVMILLAGSRGPRVGGDTPFYRDFFLRVREGGVPWLFSAANPYRTEPGYGFLNLLFSKVTDSPQVFLAAAAALTIGLRFAAMYKASSRLWVTLFAYTGLGFFGYSLCTVRQELGITVYFFAFPFLQRGKPLPYFLLTLLAASFHNSLLFLLPVYFLARLPLKRWVWWCYGGGTALALLLAVPGVRLAAALFAPGYLRDTQFFQGRNLQTAFLPFLLCASAVLLGKRLLARDERNLPLIHFSLCSAALFALTLEVFLFQRLALLFFPFAVYLLPELLACLDPVPYDPERRKQGKAAAERREAYKDAKNLYRAVLALTAAGILLYQLFLLTANRLDLVPYRAFWS